MKANAPENIFKVIGASRLNRLLLQSDTAEDALAAYEWELELGQALLKPIGITEVAVRNAIDLAICEWWRELGLAGSWTDSQHSPAGAEPLQPFLHVEDWKRRARQNIHNSSNKPRAITHDDIIAHTSLGTWKNIVGNPAAIKPKPPKDFKKRQSWFALKRRDEQCAILWKTTISDAFPFIPATKGDRDRKSPRGYIGSCLSHIAFLRNRVCHWDNLLNVDVDLSYLEMQRVVGSIDHDTLVWMDSICKNDIAALANSRPSWIQK